MVWVLSSEFPSARMGDKGLVILNKTCKNNTMKQGFKYCWNRMASMVLHCFPLLVHSALVWNIVLYCVSAPSTMPFQQKTGYWFFEKLAMKLSITNFIPSNLLVLVGQNLPFLSYWSIDLNMLLFPIKFSWIFMVSKLNVVYFLLAQSLYTN